MRILLIGKSSSRLDCLADTIRRSKRAELFILTNLSHPGLTEKGFVTIGSTDDPEFVANYADLHRSGDNTIAMISNEEPLAAGVVDALNEIGVPTIGPTKALAQIESSKSFTRHLMVKHKLAFLNPNWSVFEPGEINRIESHMCAFEDFVIKPDGLTGGKGVKVRGDHFDTISQGLQYCHELFEAGSRIVLEQKVVGLEFSLMSLSDGNTVIDMPAAQDHKRLFDLDLGPNTGGMGSYSDSDHSLPWLTKQELWNASLTNQQVIAALQKDLHQPYRGILYGNYILTRKGLRLIEFNARFGDPEVMNVLPLLETDFVDILHAISRGTLKEKHVRFRNKATVCKYLVPIGHPDNPKSGSLDISQIEQDNLVRIYRGALDGDMLTGSRAAAVVGIGDTICMAEKLAEQAANQAVGPVFHRKDIGTNAALTQKIEQAEKIRHSG